MVGKAPRKLYKIGEVMEYSGLSRQTIHNYTMLGLIRAAARTNAGHRRYSEDVFETLEEIKELKKQHTLEEIRKKLRERNKGATESGGDTADEQD